VINTVVFVSRIVDNCEWYSEQNVIEFLSRVGRHFRLGTMLSRHSVQSRLSSEAGMSFTEFCYQVFQAYDWLHLLQRYDCRFQVGGSDQMGNIVSGHDLISRVANARVYGTVGSLIYRGADKSLARPGRKQATVTEDFDFDIAYLLS